MGAATHRMEAGAEEGRGPAAIPVQMGAPPPMEAGETARQVLWSALRMYCAAEAIVITIILIVATGESKVSLNFASKSPGDRGKAEIFLKNY